MSTTIEATPFQANFKTPGDTLLNVRASNGAEFSELLSALAEHAGQIAEVETLLRAASTAAFGLTTPTVATSTTAPATPAVPQQPAGAALPRPEASHVCDHGLPMKLIPAGIAKATGKPYKAFYVCAQPRGMQCDKKVTT